MKNQRMAFAPLGVAGEFQSAKARSVWPCTLHRRPKSAVMASRWRPMMWQLAAVMVCNESFPSIRRISE